MQSSDRRHLTSENPYESPNAESTARAWRPNLATIAFNLSLLGVFGLLVVGWLSLIFEHGSIVVVVCMVLTMASSATGFILGLIAAYSPPRRLAIWAALIGFYGSMHIPTFLLSLRHYLH